MGMNVYTEKQPPYLGIYNSLYSDIINGVYPEHEKLPSEAALAEHYGVSRNTLRQALAILNEDGLIIKSQGKGTVVAPRPRENLDDKITNPLISQSKVPVTDTSISYNYGSPTDIARDRMSLTSSDVVLASNCMYLSDQQIIGYSFTQIPAAYFNMLGINTSQSDSIKEVITNTLFEHTRRLTCTIRLAMANEVEIEFLKVPLQTPVLMIEALHYGNAPTPIARNKFYFIPQYYHLNFELSM